MKVCKKIIRANWSVAKKLCSQRVNIIIDSETSVLDNIYQPPTTNFPQYFKKL